jgi:PhnB protein
MAEPQPQPRPDPSTMVGPIPYLVFGGRGNDALDFYVAAFGATGVARMPLPDAPDRLMHGQCIINGGALMLTDHQADPGVSAPTMGGHLQLVVDDGRAWFDRALAAGCSVVMPYARQDWGDDWGLMRDPFGLLWAVLQPGPEG